MPAPIRTVGLHYHLLYPLISFILLAIPSFTTADSIWYLSTSTSTEIVRPPSPHMTRLMTGRYASLPKTSTSPLRAR